MNSTPPPSAPRKPRSAAASTDRGAPGGGLGRRRPRAPLAAALALLVALALGAPAASAASPRGGDDKGVIDLGELVVEGKIQKPQVFYVLGRHVFTYRGLSLQRSFVQRILADARKNPF